MNNSPVIVIGMHRSGTSALVRTLAELGMFIGYDLEPNAEARYFLQLNEKMLKMCGARWDSPDAMLKVHQNSELIDWLAAWAEPKMKGFDTKLYLSKPGWFKYKDIRNYPGLWGWKDPRNTLTLPIWLKLFPNAKVIHVVRHGVDVAASLRVRENELMQRTLASENFAKHWSITSPRCLDIDYGFKLWESYTQAAEEMLTLIPEHQQMTVNFEAWLKEPMPYLSQLSNWLGLNAGEEKLQVIADELRVDRRFAFLQSEELTTFAEHKFHASPLLQKYYAHSVAKK